MNKEKLRELLNIQWNGSDDMVEHCLRNCAYIQYDNKFIDVGALKPSITKTLWFDDEKPIPKLTKELFIDRNLKYNAPRKFDLENDHHERLILVPKYYDDKTEFALCSLTYGERTYQSYEYVDSDMLFQINKKIIELQAKYIKRLENYWKRYKKHVSCRGYWVNR